VLTEVPLAFVFALSPLPFASPMYIREAISATRNSKTMHEQMRAIRRLQGFPDAVVRMLVWKYRIGSVVRSGSGMSMAV
jgi:hypothetical protein